MLSVFNEEKQSENGNQQEETREIILGPESDHTSYELLTKILMKFDDIFVKETCYGCIIQGPKDKINSIVLYLRELDPYNIFTRRRGFYLGDPRICRRLRFGGQRFGFSFLEFEFTVLKHISRALKSFDKKEKESEERKTTPEKKAKVDIQVFNKILKDMI
ncbi:MAG: DUF2102 domain-containing protein [Candidatus Lokiarchaeota archaeon]|nr:DUF2102 domain-containing protein [Candidatus Lokiarchaeota archaeon]